MNTVEFEEKCYRAYQLEWMLSHGHSLAEIENTYRNALEDSVLNDGSIETVDEMDEVLYDIRDVFLNSQGFDQGSIFVCKDEFLDAEFRDPDYMEHLISLMPNSDEMKEFWNEQYLNNEKENDDYEV